MKRLRITRVALGRTAVGLVASTAVAGLLSALVSCNSILGISSATLLEDAGVDLVLADAASKASCAEYCATVIANCRGENAEYIDVAEQLHVCLSVCGNGAWDDGNPGDLTGDSLACRVTHAVLARDNPALHCQAAGPIGGGVCGDKCNGFCEQVQPFCADLSYDASTSNCVADCQAYTYHTGPDAGDLPEEEDNTLNCRVYHLENAYRSDLNRTTHCPHTDINSVVCTGPDDGG